MTFLIRGIFGLAGLGVMLQLDCGSILSLTGLFPKAAQLLSFLPAINLPSGGTTQQTIVLKPTTKTITTGVFLKVQNNTQNDIAVFFEADGQSYEADVSKSQIEQTFELATPSASTTVTAETINLNGTWTDPNSGQQLIFTNGALTTFVDENRLVHTFDPANPNQADLVSTFPTGQSGKPTVISLINTLVSVFCTPDFPAAGIVEKRKYAFQPNAAGNSLKGKFEVSSVSACDSDTPITGSTTTSGDITFLRLFPNTIKAVSEKDTDPTTHQLVAEFTYTPPPGELVQANGDYNFGQTIIFRVNLTTVSFVVQ
jgi:hypothetical protein